jgi:ATP-dependent DNA ligase
VLGGHCNPGSTQAARLSATTCGYPLIVEAALKNRATSFVIDGEAMLLGIDGVSDFNGLHSRKHDDASSSTPSIS